MRIDRIEIDSLASLRGEQQAIELTMGELAEAGLIAITGPTGAGKSTILDAVCLALYDQTPRLSGQGNDARELLSRGAVAARAAVELTLDDGRRWRAEWSVHRARHDADGNLQPTKPRLFERVEDSNQDHSSPSDSLELIADGKRPVQEMVEQGLGLTFDQFTGVILLAQGDFARFLQAKQDKRSELLERLTGTEIYSRLSRGAFEQHRALRQELLNLQERARDIVTMADDQRQLLEAELDRLEPTLARVEADLTADADALRWLSALGRLLADYRQADRALAAAMSADDAAEVERQRLVAAEAAIGLAGALRAVDDRRRDTARRHSDVDTARQALNDAETTLRVAAQGLSTQLADDQAWSRQLGRATRALAGFAALDDGRLNSLRDLRRQAVDAERAIATSGSLIAAVERQIEAELPQLEAANSRLETTRRTVTELVNRGLELAERRRRAGGDKAAEAATARRLRLLRAIEVVDELERLDVIDHRLQAESTTSDLEQAEAEADAARALARSAATDLEDHEQLRQLAIQGAKIAEHRHLLVAGEPCPLCGAIEHPWTGGNPSAEAGEEPEALRVADLRRQELKRQLDRAEASADQARQALDAARSRSIEAAQRWQAVIQRQQRLGSDWLELRLQLAELPTTPEALTDNGLRRLIEEVDARLHEIDQLRADEQVHQSDLERARQQQAEAASAVTVAEGRLEQLGRQRQEQAERHAAHVATAASADSAFAAAAADLAQNSPFELLPESGTKAGIETDIETELERLQDGLQRHRAVAELNRRQQQLERHLLVRARQLAEPDANLVSPANPDRDAETDTSADTDSVEIDVASLVEQLDQLEPSLSRATDSAARAQSNRQNAQSRFDSLSGAAELADAERQQAETELTNQLPASGFADEAALRAATLDQEQLTTLRQQLEDGRRLLERWRTRHEDARQAIERHLEDHATAGLELDLDVLLAFDGDQALPATVSAHQRQIEQRMLEQRARHTTMVKRKSAADYELKRDDENRRLRRQFDQRTADLGQQVEVAARLHDLIGHNSGEKFRRFAQQLNLDRLLQLANLRLDRLAPRYHLKRLDDSLDLEVVDREMADERRSVNTLSGGESFLVSLALALALADLKRGHLTLGTLFLDEGFGSLDQDTLDTALSVLEGLQADQKTQILLISHVGALRERIDHRIDVKMRGGGRSSIDVVIGDG